MPTTPKEMTHAVLLVNGAYVLQLRDDIPGIAARGMWALFGGALEDGEPPEVGLRREILEELGVLLPDSRLLWHVDRYSDFWRAVLQHWFFVADVTPLWPSHVVREGQAAQLFRYDELPASGIPPIIREALARHNSGQVEP